MARRTPSIYLDYSASTPLDDRVRAGMEPYFGQQFGNASSAHELGRSAESAVESARDRLALLLHCKPQEIVFTSGGSESDNLAIRGAGLAMRRETGRTCIVTTRAEHHAVSRTVDQMDEWLGFESHFVGVDSAGRANLDELHAVAAEAAVISLMLANNEVGTLQNVTAAADMAHAGGALFHTDAVQAGGQLMLDVQTLGVDLLSLSAHKFYGPKGVGLLFIREGSPIAPVQTGGSHERGLRAGTLNVPGIVGMAAALDLAMQERDDRTHRIQRLRDQLVTGILAQVPGVFLTGDPVDRLPSHASFAFEGVDGNLLLMHLDSRGVMASSGSACKTGSPEPSEVLLAMGYSSDLALSSLRLTVGQGTTESEIEIAIDTVVEAVAAVRRLSAVYSG